MLLWMLWCIKKIIKKASKIYAEEPTDSEFERIFVIISYSQYFIRNLFIYFNHYNRTHSWILIFKQR